MGGALQLRLVNDIAFLIYHRAAVLFGDGSKAPHEPVFEIIARGGLGEELTGWVEQTTRLIEKLARGHGDLLHGVEPLDDQRVDADSLLYDLIGVVILS